MMKLDLVDEKKILLHCCCGPCAEYPLQDLLTDGYKPHLYYFNPNIQPQVEWERRLQSVQKLSEILSLPSSFAGEAQTAKWLQMAAKDTDRCIFCYRIRLEAAAQYAFQNKFKLFSTTLLVSPYQDNDIITSLGNEIAKNYGLIFLARDWRPSFRQGQQLAKEHGLYRQRYCGCILSLEESSFKEKIKKELEELENNQG